MADHNENDLIRDSLRQFLPFLLIHISRTTVEAMFVRLMVLTPTQYYSFKLSSQSVTTAKAYMKKAQCVMLFPIFIVDLVQCWTIAHFTLLLMCWSLSCFNRFKNLQNMIVSFPSLSLYPSISDGSMLLMIIAALVEEYLDL